MTANRDPCNLVASSAITGNFCKVVMMIRAFAEDNASRNWEECWSIFWITPGVWSKEVTVDCNCRSSATRSVTMMTLLNTG